MFTEKTNENGILTVYMKGRLDTATAPQAESELEADVAAAKELILDMKELRYVSSAGLRLLLKLHKAMSKKDGMRLRNVNESIREILDLTGFTDILHIES